MRPLVELVRDSIASWNGRLELALLGTDDPPRIAAELERFVADAIGPPVGALLYRPGVGIVAGFALADGSSIVVKVHRWNVSTERLAATQVVQRHLADAGIPAPRPLAGPAPLGRGIATVEDHLTGDRADGRDAAVRASLAQGLFRLVDSARSFAGVGVGAPLVIRPPGAPLWPEPHDLRFDFEATAAGAEWIDDAAREARRRLVVDASPPVLGHFDWRVENVGFDGSRITAIYDWDSIAAAPEPVLVGVDAAQFCTDWGSGEADPLPSVDDMVAFVDDYEHARGARFGDDERRQLDAANLALIAYGARCQHSDARFHPEIAPDPSGRWFRLLRERGDHLFDAAG